MVIKRNIYYNIVLRVLIPSFIFDLAIISSTYVYIVIIVICLYPLSLDLVETSRNLSQVK